MIFRRELMEKNHISTLLRATDDLAPEINRIVRKQQEQAENLITDRML